MPVIGLESLGWTLGRIEVARLRSALRAKAEARLQPFLGTAIRGVLARSMRRLTCAGRCSGRFIGMRCQTDAAPCVFMAGLELEPS